jgi:hypothetical protein
MEAHGGAGMSEAEAEAQAPEQTADDDASPEEIEEAKSLGWKSPDQWKGKPPANGFKSARAYLEQGRAMLPVVESQLKKARDREAALQAKLDKVERESAQRYENLERMSKVALDEQRRQIEARYEARKEAAIEVGDKAAYREHVKEEKAALAELDEKIKPPKEEDKKADGDLPAHIREAIDSWKAENRWFDADEDMRAVAERQHNKLIREKPNLSLRENLDLVAEHVRKKFPAEFKSDDGDEEDEQPKRRGSPVESGSRVGGGSRSTWSRVPSDARKVAEGAGHIELFLAKGETMEKNAANARERWAAKYFEGVEQ